MSHEVKAFESDRQIVYNGVQCLACGQLIESTFRHDYKVCDCPNRAMVAGGLSYLRTSGLSMDFVRPITYYLDDPFETVRKFAFRLNMEGKAVRLYKMSNNWLDNAIEDMMERNYGPAWHLQLLIAEKQFRFENEIYVEEDPTETRKFEAIRAKLLKKDSPEEKFKGNTFTECSVG